MSRETKRGMVRSASSARELFTVMNDNWKISEAPSGLYELSVRDGSAKFGPLEGSKLVGVLAVLSELDRHLREGR